MSGHVGNLSPEQANALHNLREQLPETQQQLDDYHLLRYLRARKFHVEKAKAMLMATVEWRETNNMDSIFDNPPPKHLHTIRVLARATMHKTCKAGYPLAISHFGGQISAGVEKILSVEEYGLVTGYLKDLEQKHCREESEKRNTKVECITAVLDMKGLSQKSLKALEYLKMGTFIAENHYPETLGNLVVINAPWIFPMLYNISKPFLDHEVKSKVRVIRGNPKKALLQLIDPENLPVEYGGTCECKDGCLYGTEDEKNKIIAQYRDGNENSDEIPEDIHHTVIHAREELEKVLQCGEHGGLFGRYFQLNSTDIEFSVEWHSVDSSTTVSVQKPERVKVQYAMTGSYQADSEGFCKFVWSNKYSRMRKKKLSYSISVALMGGDEEEEQKSDQQEDED